jgi:hypothetical protein
VRTVPGIVSLSGRSAVELPDPGRIAGGSVHLNNLIRELESQGLQDAFDQLQALPVVRQLYSVEQMVAISRITNNRLRPSLPPQEPSDLYGPPEGRTLLCVGRGYPRRPCCRVEVQGSQRRRTMSLSEVVGSL